MVKKKKSEVKQSWIQMLALQPVTCVVKKLALSPEPLDSHL